MLWLSFIRTPSSLVGHRSFFVFSFPATRSRTLIEGREEKDKEKRAAAAGCGGVGRGEEGEGPPPPDVGRGTGRTA